MPGLGSDAQDGDVDRCVIFPLLGKRVSVEIQNTANDLNASTLVEGTQAPLVISRHPCLGNLAEKEAQRRGIPVS